MKAIRPLCLPPSYQDAADQGRLILRDGSTASMRLSRPEDLSAAKEFFARLSPASRRMRFFSESKPGEDVLSMLCDSGNPLKQMTLLVFRVTGGANRIIASGSYIAHNKAKAEFAVAVDDDFQGLGLGSLLLERLAVLAATQGFTEFVAVTHPTNRPMLEVFRSSGFPIKEHFEDGCIAIDLSVHPGAESTAHAELRDRVFTKASIRPFFNPKSVAVIGASREPGSFGHRIMEALVRNGFSGPVYPVNPHAQVICSIKAYPKASAIPEPVDLAIIAVSRRQILEVVDDCALRGIRAIIAIASGFAEAGEDGAQLQAKLVEKVRSYGMRLIGPNCLGLINTDPAVRLNASFAAGFPAPGRIAVSSQSGALGLALLNLARQRELGLSMFVSVGNKADVTGNDLLYYWEDDPSVDVILLYLESFGNPRRFARIARQVSRRKPILCVKSGRGRAGDTAVDALFRQTGVVRSDTLEDMFDAGALMGNQPLPAGKRVAILTNSFGCGILCRDTCEAGGLSLPGPSGDFARAAAGALPELATIGGIVDLTTDATPAHYKASAQALLSDPDVDALIVCYVPLGTAETHAILRAVGEGVGHARAGNGAGKPVACVVMSGEASRGVIRAGNENLPCYLFPETAARALIAASEYAEWRRAPAGVFLDFADTDPQAARTLCRRIAETGDGRWLSADETAAIAGCFKLPLASESGDGASACLGIREDPTFGPVISFALCHGGTPEAEDFLYRVTPLTDRDAAEMIQLVRGQSALAQTDRDALQEILLRISLLVEEVPEIREVSIARMAVGSAGKGCGLHELKIRVGPPPRGARSPGAR